MGTTMEHAHCIRHPLGISWTYAANRGHPVTQSRRVRLFRSGRNQAVRIPREFELPGREATIRKVGNRLILESARRKSLLQVLAAMRPLAVGDELPDVDETLTALDEDPFVAGDASDRP